MCNNIGNSFVTINAPNKQCLQFWKFETEKQESNEEGDFNQFFKIEIDYSTHRFDYDFWIRYS